MGNKAHIIYIGSGSQGGGGSGTGWLPNKRVVTDDDVITGLDDFIMCEHNHPITLTLAISCLDKISPIHVKDISGNASQNAVTIVGENGEPIDEAGELIIDHDFMSYEIISASTDYYIK